jgi:hypothetical protein
MILYEQDREIKKHYKISESTLIHLGINTIVRYKRTLIQHYICMSTKKISANRILAILLVWILARCHMKLTVYSVEKDEDMLDKDATSYGWCSDAFRLAMKICYFRSYHYHILQESLQSFQYEISFCFWVCSWVCKCFDHVKWCNFWILFLTH